MLKFNKTSLLLLTILALSVIKTHQLSVVIIGAGPAGIAAATRLLENNITNIIVLEAEDRIGGRVNSVPFGDATVELGAEWCHGEQGNVVYEMVKDLGLLEDFGNGTEIVFSNGKAIESNESIAFLNLIHEVYDSIDDEEHGNHSVGDYFTEAIPVAIKNLFKDDEDTLNLALKSVPLIEKCLLALESAFTWNDVGLGSTYKNCPGNFNLAWKGKGYKQIFDVMSKNIPKSAEAPLPLADKIHLNEVVSKIDYSASKPVITCMDDTEYTPDYVIFTPSLGVMKHDHKQLFHPSLTEEKASAIEDVGIGAVIKVLQSYPVIWWPSELKLGFAFSWNDEDDEEAAKALSTGFIKNGKSWVSAVTSMIPAEHNPNVVYIWMIGPFVPEIEQLSDNEVQTGISYVLNKFLGQNYNVSKPDNMMRYGWYTNPHFRGTYSYDSLRTKRDGEPCRVILSKPAKNSDGKEILFFAGEATSTNYYGTVHGAIESGHREADRILSFK